MTYRAGIGPMFSAETGGPVGGSDPFLTCDRCGATESVVTARGDVSQTWMNRRTLRGWKTVRQENEDGSVTRDDVCPRCRKGVP